MSEHITLRQRGRRWSFMREDAVWWATWFSDRQEAREHLTYRGFTRHPELEEMQDHEVWVRSAGGPHPLCSICRRRHGPEVQHASE